MNCNYKVRHTNLDQATLDYCEKRMARIKKLLPANSYMEIEFIDEFGKRGGLDKRVQVDISMPGEKQAIHLENSALDWKSSIDYLQNRLEEDLLRRKEKRIDEGRGPRPDKL
ncbi:MAG: HPF/RaiA family ribosome-associated protein [bacterium]|nr:HPF/RaiA family ribosome-associated protein [bacterium]